MLANFIFVLVVLFSTGAYAVENPVATDSRVRTYVYGENEVFKIISKYGYQSNIQFGEREEVQTISIGDSVSWKITPAGNRLFVKSMEENVSTNMTVVTSERSYQFDLTSKVENEEDVVYVVRFFYPDMDFDARKRRPDSNAFESGELIDAAYNFNYSLTGPREIAPIQVFDDGKFTFFKFAGNNAVVPNINMVDGEGNEVPVVSRDDGEYIVIERIFKQFALRKGDAIVCVFNDSMVGGGPRIK